MMKLNQKDGYDCPGCAWPDPDNDRSHTEFCENGVKAVAEEGTTKRATPEFFNRWSVQALSEKNDLFLGKQGRITHPMWLAPNKDYYESIPWERAYQIISDSLKSLSDPNQAIFYTSGRTSNEAAFLYQLLIRRFGTNNMPDCSNMCHESSGVALKETHIHVHVHKHMHIHKH